MFLGLAAALLFSPLLTKIGCRASRFVSKKEAPNEILKQNSADAFGKTILSIRRDIEEYEDDITINKLKTTYYNMANIDDLSDDNNDKVYHNEININEALEITDKSDKEDKYNKYISYQDVDSDARTPNIDNAKSNEIYNVKDYANKYIYFTVKSI